jgi:cyclophilin family peptidyl-prolyl cis-trans isomerase
MVGCGKKSETTDIIKKDNTTQMNTTNTTPKTDTVKPIKDTLAEILKTKPDTVIMETSMGKMTIELYSKDAPLHVTNFKKLVLSKFFDGLLFHRVIKDFMIQGGDPNSRSGDPATWGQGGPGYTIPAEIKLKHEVGSLAAARTDNPKKESSGSQFYIVTGQASHLDNQYTVFGKVIKGIEIAMKIQDVKTTGAPTDRPLVNVVIKKVYFAK